MFFLGNISQVQEWFYYCLSKQVEYFNEQVISSILALVLINFEEEFSAALKNFLFSFWYLEVIQVVIFTVAMAWL